MLKRLFGRNHGKLQPAIWPSVMPCCIQACIYPASTNRSQGRASAFPFSGIRNASSSEKKKYDKSRISSNQSNWCHFQPPPFMQSPVAALPQTLLLSCDENAGTRGCQEHPWPGTARTSHSVNRQRLLDSCVQEWGLRMSESAFIRVLA